MTFQSLLDANVHALNEGVELIQLLSPDQYGSGFEPAFQATIGAHYRHVIEHYRCLLSQIAKGVFCYDKRERDEGLELNCEYALESIADIINKLETMDGKLFDRQYRIVDQQSDFPLTTTLQRELLFLQSHTVHHYAMIAGITRGLGKQPMCDFGVAIATINHREEKQEHDNVVSNQESSAGSTAEQSSNRSNACAR